MTLGKYVVVKVRPNQFHVKQEFFYDNGKKSANLIFFSDFGSDEYGARQEANRMNADFRGQ